MVSQDQHQYHSPHQTYLINSHWLHLSIASYKIQSIHPPIFLNQNFIFAIRLHCRIHGSSQLKSKWKVVFNNLPPYRIFVSARSFASASKLCVPGNVPFFSIVMAFLRAISSKRFLSIRSPSRSSLRRCLDDDLDRVRLQINKFFQYMQHII